MLINLAMESISSGRCVFLTQFTSFCVCFLTVLNDSMISRQKFNNHGLGKIKSSQLKVKEKHFRLEVLGCGWSVMREIPSKCLTPELRYFRYSIFYLENWLSINR